MCQRTLTPRKIPVFCLNDIFTISVIWAPPIGVGGCFPLLVLKMKQFPVDEIHGLTMFVLGSLCHTMTRHVVDNRRTITIMKEPQGLFWVKKSFLDSCTVHLLLINRHDRRAATFTSAMVKIAVIDRIDIIILTHLDTIVFLQPWSYQE